MVFIEAKGAECTPTLLSSTGQRVVHTHQLCEQRFADQNLKIEKRISELDSKFEKRFNSTESDLRVLKWGQAVLVAAVLLPQVARLVS